MIFTLIVILNSRIFKINFFWTFFYTRIYDICLLDLTLFYTLNSNNVLVLDLPFLHVLLFNNDLLYRELIFGTFSILFTELNSRALTLTPDINLNPIVIALQTVNSAFHQSFLLLYLTLQYTTLHYFNNSSWS